MKVSHVMSSRTLAHYAPGRIILLSLMAIILIGTVLLALPCARYTAISYLDLFFTATSTVCVTGLFTVPIEQFTPFGLTVLLFLMQIGGLGVITLTLFVFSLFFELGFSTQLFAGSVMDMQQSWKNTTTILAWIIAVTICAELLGAIAIFSSIYPYYSISKALFIALFHSVSSFCNAGITIFNFSEHTQFASNYSLLIITSSLMLAGSIGFFVLWEILNYIKARIAHKRHAWSLVAKLSIMGTIVAVIIPAAMLFTIEYSHAFAQMTSVQKLLNALYNSISLRSTGLLSVPIQSLQAPSLLLIIVTGFIGACPGSTGSGVRITTFIVLLATLRAVLSGNLSVNIKGRKIASDQVFKAITIITLTMFWIISILFFMLITQSMNSFIEIIFELVSATCNVGLSLGITQSLTALSKLFIMLSMVVGRIGSLTLVLALKRNNFSKTERISYPEERIMLS